MEQVLSGIRVLDLTRVLAGPYCTQILSDMGAEIIKVETPNAGDDTRFFGPFQEKVSLYFNNLNRNKKSITLDMKIPKSKDALLALVKTCDVFIENFSPGVAARLGLGYEDLKKVKPDIIAASISGFGQNGPFRDYSAYDLTVQGLSGLASVNGFPNNPPVRTGVSAADMTSGMYAALGILGALLYKKQSGKGQYIDIAMMDSTLTFMEALPIVALATGKAPGRIGSRHPAGGPFNIYKTKDGYVTIACANESLWQRITKVIGREDLAFHEEWNSIPKRLIKIDEVDELVESWTSVKTTAEVIKPMQEMGVPCQAVNDLKQALESEQVAARKMVADVDHPAAGTVKVINSPIKYSDVYCGAKKAAPTLGQHNNEILCELLGFTETEVEEMQGKKQVSK